MATPVLPREEADELSREPASSLSVDVSTLLNKRTETATAGAILSSQEGAWIERSEHRSGSRMSVQVGRMIDVK